MFCADAPPDSNLKKRVSIRCNAKLNEKTSPCPLQTACHCTMARWRWTPRNRAFACPGGPSRDPCKNCNYQCADGPTNCFVRLPSQLSLDCQFFPNPVLFWSRSKFVPPEPASSRTTALVTRLELPKSGPSSASEHHFVPLTKPTFVHILELDVPTTLDPKAVHETKTSNITRNSEL